MNATNSNQAQNAKSRRPRRRGRRASAELLYEVERLSLLGMAATEIHKHLKSMPKFAGHVPSVRSIQNYIRDLAPLEPSEPWTLRRGDENAALILPVLAAVLEETEGHQHLTNDEAGWVVTIRRVAPDLPPFKVYRLARFYLVRQQKGLPTHDLDALLAYAPWRGVGASVRYRMAVGSGRITPPMAYWKYTGKEGLSAEDPDFEWLLGKEVWDDYRRRRKEISDYLQRRDEPSKQQLGEDQP